eukprot:gene4549-4877_t
MHQTRFINAAGSYLKDITKLSRVFYQPAVQSLQVGKIIEVTDPQLIHYMGTVIRLKPGLQIRIFNENDGEFVCEVTGSIDSSSRNRRSKDSIRLEVLANTREPDTNQRNLIEVELLFSPIRKENTKLLLEKCTELGVKQFRPIITQNCQHEKLFKHSDTLPQSSKKGVKVINEEDIPRDLQTFQNILIQSCEQSERMTIPKILPLLTLSQLIQLRKGHTSLERQSNPLFVCRERSMSSPPILSALKEHFPSSTSSTPTPITVSLFVGPEGGFQEEEFNQLSSICRFISLGNNVLKAETAGITAISTTQHFIDDCNFTFYQREKKE